MTRFAPTLNNSAIKTFGTSVFWHAVLRETLPVVLENGIKGHGQRKLLQINVHIPNGVARPHVVLHKNPEDAVRCAIEHAATFNQTRADIALLAVFTTRLDPNRLNYSPNILLEHAANLPRKRFLRQSNTSFFQQFGRLLYEGDVPANCIGLESVFQIDVPPADAFQAWRQKGEMFPAPRNQPICDAAYTDTDTHPFDGAFFWHGTIIDSVASILETGITATTPALNATEASPFLYASLTTNLQVATFYANLNIALRYKRGKEIPDDEHITPEIALIRIPGNALPVGKICADYASRGNVLDAMENIPQIDPGLRGRLAFQMLQDCHSIGFLGDIPVQPDWIFSPTQLPLLSFKDLHAEFSDFRVKHPERKAWLANPTMQPTRLDALSSLAA